MALHYYVQKQYVEDGQRKTPANYPYETRAEAERQYDLMLAAAWKNEIDIAEPTMLVEMEAIELGTIEQGKIKREFLVHTKPAPEPEPEGEEEPVEGE